VGENKPLVEGRWAELGAFLRRHREALDPRSFGLPHTRRHVAGLRREEVAHVAAISVSWYAMLEQGRVRAIGEKTLARVADALRLSPSERDFVVELARTPRAASDTEIPASLRAFVTGATSSATLLMSARFDMLAWNRATDDLFGYSQLEPPLNLLELLLFEERVASRFADRAATLRNMIALLHAKVALVGGDDLGSFVTSLTERSVLFRELWAKGDVAHEPESTCVVVTPDGNSATFSLDAFVPLAAPSSIVIALTRQSL
jgi:transcriptional regulator with XRE-family HTH domain